MTTHVLESMNEVVTNNYDKDHQAIDIVAADKTETNIIALESGIVTKAVKNVKGTNHKSKGLATYGNYVKIKQNDGKTALYAHMKYGSVRVNEGTYIEKGTVLRTIGETGNAYGKHLHLEIQNQNNNKENPLDTLNKKQINSDKPKTQKQKTQNTKISYTPNKQSKQSQIAYLHAGNYHHGSIVDALKSINSDSSYNYRKKLAQINGINNYTGSYSQNVKMLSLLKQGKLKKA